APGAAPKAQAARRSRGIAAGAPAGGDGDGFLAVDMLKRDDAPPMFRPVDKTQEWAEHNWWHRTPAESGAAMIGANRLWRDLAHALASDRSAAFLSPWLGLATGSLAEAMCALAVT